MPRPVPSQLRRRPRPAGRRTRALLAGAAAAAVVAAGVTTLAATADAAPATAAAASSCPKPSGAKVAAASVPDGDVKIFGHGWGHGMGMSQYGAQGAARLGCGYRTILDTYYSGTQIDTRSLQARVVLSLANATKKSSLDAIGGPVRWLVGSVAASQPQGRTWSVVPLTKDGAEGVAVKDEDGKVKLFAGPGTYLSAKHTGTIVTVRAAAKSLTTRWDTARFIRNGDAMSATELIGPTGKTTAVQKYLAGLGEVPLSWPIEALKAQVVAARTYLTSKYSAELGMYKVTTTTSDQVYLGVSQELKDAALGGDWKKAVSATKGQVIVDASTGKAIEAMYSSSMGGYTENRQYVYGRYGISYLKAVDDSAWDNASDNTYRSWSRGFSRTDFARRLGFDSVSSWKIGKRGSDSRVATGLVVTGKAGGKTVTREFTGSTAKSKLGLKSPGFTFSS